MNHWRRINRLRLIVHSKIPILRIESRRIALVGITSLIIPGMVSSQTPIVTVADAAALQAHGMQQDKSIRKLPRVTLTVKDSTIEYIINALVKQAKLRTVYNDSSPVYGKRVSINVVKVDLMETLDQLLKGTDLIAKLTPGGETVMIRSKEKGSAASLKVSQQETGTISGGVIDSATHKPVSGVAVTVLGTSHVTLTDERGNFAFKNVSVGDHTVQFKLLGYTSTKRTVKIAAQGTATLRVTLIQSASMLSGVVTTATGERRKVEIGNSSISLNVDSIMQVAPINTVTDLIEGRVPGVTVQRSSGTPGDPARIRMRGTSSINQNNDPIIIVDQVRIYNRQSDDRNINNSGEYNARSYAAPSALDMIDPNSIERIEILRGPSAASMYGSDAANGVIVITTKRGQAGRTRTDLTLHTGTSYMPGQWPEVTYRFGTPLVGGPPVLCLGYCGDVRIDSTVRFQALNDPRLTALGRGSAFGGSSTVSGGNQQMQYSFTGSLGNTLGILKLPVIEKERYLRFQGTPAPKWMQRPDQLETQGIQASVQIQLAPNVDVSASTNLAHNIQRRTSMSTSQSSAISTLQQAWVDLSQLNEKPILGNPYERVVSDNSTIQHNVQVQLKQWTWLPLNVQIGSYALTENVEMSIARGLTVDQDSGGTVRGKTKNSTNFTGRVITQLPVHRLMTVGAGLELTQGRTNDQSGFFRGIPQGVTDPSSGEETASNSFTRASSEDRSFGWFIDPRFNIASRFFVMPGFRLDNNGLSGANAKFNALPKMDLSWVMSDEPFFPWKNVVNLFRPRIAFGVSGITPNPGDQLRLFQKVDGNPFGGVEPLYGEMLSLNRLGNTKLRPERAREIEGGFDIDLLNGRFGFDITYYQKLRKDAIVENNFATSVYGGGTSRMNVGDIKNNGVEISLATTLLERDLLRLSLTSTFTRKRSEVLRLSEDGAAIVFDGISGAGGTRYVVGYPMEGVWELPILGYADADGNGWIQSSEVVVGKDLTYIGSTEPGYLASISPTISLFRGQVSFTTLLSFTGDYMQSMAQYGLFNRLRDGGLSPFIGDLIEGPEGFGNQVSLMGLNGKLVQGALMRRGTMQNVNVLRVQSVSVMVNLGTHATRVLRARTASIALQGSNLGLWTNYIGVDPNVNGALGGRGLLDTGGLPQTREWRLQLRMGY